MVDLPRIPSVHHQAARVAAISSPARKPISAVTTGPNSILPQFVSQPRSVFYAAQFWQLLGQNADGRFAFVAKVRDARTDRPDQVAASSNLASGRAEIAYFFRAATRLGSERIFGTQVAGPGR